MLEQPRGPATSSSAGRAGIARPCWVERGKPDGPRKPHLAARSGAARSRSSGGAGGVGRQVPARAPASAAGAFSIRRGGDRRAGSAGARPRRASTSGAMIASPLRSRTRISVG